MAKRDFNEFRFSGLNYKECSNKYLTMDRVSVDETKIVVKIDAGHLVKTKYGFAVILDDKHVVFIKDWAVDMNYYGNEILLTKEFFTVKEWGDFPDYADNDENLNWEHWVEVARSQENLKNEDGEKLNRVKWSK